MGRYSGTLHKLADAGSAKPGNWNLLLNYLEGYAFTDSHAKNPRFDSPLPPYTAANVDLARELVDSQGPKREDTPLRIAIGRMAPANIVAALCHLGPEATRMTDGKGRLPLHWACRHRSSDPKVDKETDSVLAILIMAYPEALIHRDDDGRTPLHYLLWFHASTRPAKVVQLFCQPMSESAFVGMKQPPRRSKVKDPFPLPQIPKPDPSNKVPCSAVIVYDMKHGALPLHYAAAEGASKDVIKVLLQAYPASKVLCDRRGRTALAWYLGAGELADRFTHVSGEPPDPNGQAIWEKRLSSTVVQLLLSSKVARTPDEDTGRYPLHWAMHLLAQYYYSCIPTTTSDSQSTSTPCLSFGSVQLLLDNNIEALMIQDGLGMTPLHVLFYAVAQHQESEWARVARNKTFRDDVDLLVGGSTLHVSFEPPADLLEMLLRPPDSNLALLPVGERPMCAAHVEDHEGRLPLHIALMAAPSANAIRLLIQSHPTSLLHTTEEELKTPLHMALCSPYVTPLQSLDAIKLLLQAYVTSRHGTFVDGRLVLKLEDASGRYPLHYACENQASLEVTRLLFLSYPKAAKYQNAKGDYPIHSLLDPNLFGVSESRGVTIGATLAKPTGWTSDAEDAFRAQQLNVMQRKMALLIEPLARDEEALRVTSDQHGMSLLHIAVAFDAVSYTTLYQMLLTHPQGAKLFTTAKNNVYSPLDLHAMRRPSVKDEERWHMIRELLFSFSPALEAHRRQDELLDRSARIIRDELVGQGSAHSIALAAAKTIEIPQLDLKASLSSIEVPEIDGGGRPQKAKSPKTPKTPQRNASKAEKVEPLVSPRLSVKEKSPPAKKSIYDDDADIGYEVSPDASYASDDYFSDQLSQEEEYFSDEYDSRYDEDDNSMFDDDAFKQSRSKDEQAKKEKKPKNAKSGQEEATVSLTSQHDSESLHQSPNDSDRPFVSDVAMRLWFFFATFVNPSTPGDHYAKQVEFILDHLNFYTVQRLLLLPLPSYIEDYIDEDTDLKGKGIQDIANASCKAVMHMTFYFVGRYEFRTSQSENILIRRSMDGDTVVVHATEQRAEAVNYSEERDPGDAEAEIWASGEAPSEPVTKSDFRVSKRSVCIKFMRSLHAYNNEVECRKLLGVPVEDESRTSTIVVPLINHFNANGNDRLADQRYRHDIQDDRFQRLQLGDGSRNDDDNYLFLPDYPYAVVMPYSDHGDLGDYIFRNGVLKPDKIREIGVQVGKSLLLMHEKGLVYGNVSLRNVASVPLSEETTLESTTYWALSDLSCATRQTDSTSFMAPIPLTGSVQFSTSAFPPEMFVELSPGELKMYNDYWETVESKHGGEVDKTVIQPRLDAITGDAHVLRCHLVGSDSALPPLPYKLLTIQEAVDIWSFGQFLFTLCSSGYPLFPTNLRTGQLLDYRQVASWDRESRERLIYGHVEDPLAQDVLLHLLTSHEERAMLHMETILKHPFFTTRVDNVKSSDKAIRRLVEQRVSDRVACKRSFERTVLMRSEDEWLQSRSEKVSVYDLDFQMRMYLAPSQFVKREYSTGQRVGTIPYGIVLLPYKLVRNKAGKLTPSTKSDVELAERMGVQLIALSKASHFALRMEEVLCDPQASAQKWSLSEITDSMNLATDHFSDLLGQFSSLATEKVVAFRDSPLDIAKRLVRERISEVLTLFQSSGKAFLYLVDEYQGIPLVGTMGGMTYPIEISNKVPEMVARGLPFMYCCILYAEGVAGDISGLVKLIFEAAYPHIPPSWSTAADGLRHVLDESHLSGEVRILRESAAGDSRRGAARGIDDMHFFQDYFERVDVKRIFANLKRVTNGELALWTSEDGVEQIKQLAASRSLTEAYRANKDATEQLMKQQQKILELEETIEKLEFRRKHNLQEPFVS